MTDLDSSAILMFVLLLVAVFFGTSILVFVYFFARDKEPVKKCPYCAEKIKLEARICRFCGREVGETAVEDTHK